MRLEARLSFWAALIKKEAAADGAVEPPAEVPGAGVTRAVVHAVPRPHALDMRSEPAVGGQSRTVSATATAATAASARQVGGKKLLTLERLHTPSRHCWACMVTVLSAPPRPAGATDTWTLGPDGQAAAFLLSGPTGGCLPMRPTGPGGSLGLGAPRPPREASGSSWLAGVCNRRRASRVSWCRCVVHTSQRLSVSGRHDG